MSLFRMMCGTTCEPRLSSYRSLRNASTSCSKACGLSIFDPWEAAGITTRRTSFSAVCSPSRMRWKSSGERSPAMSSVGALIASASAREKGARCSLICPEQRAGVISHLPFTLFWQIRPTAWAADNVDRWCETLVNLAMADAFGGLREK
jgi:hypothetical protein